MKPKKWSLISNLTFTFVLALVAIVPTIGNAAVIAVNSTLDAVDTNPADGVCQTAAGTCTLRAAIQTANANPASDTITLPAGTYTLTIAGTGENAAATGDLDVTGLGGPLSITGAGAATTIIDGGALDTVFETIFAGGQGANANISDVTIRNGNNALGSGGGIHVNTGTTLTLNRVVVTACKAFGANAGASGVDNSGTLNMNTVAVTNNDGPGGGVNNGAAGVLTWNIGEVSGNKNTDVNAGGGGIQNNGTITLTNITVSGNNSTGQGAGIDARGTVALQNVTVSGNTSTAGPVAIGGVRNNAAVSITARNTIISGNLPANCGGAITSQGNNIDNGNSCLFAGPGDLPNTDPLLGALALNGAANLPALKTRALLAGSPAIDAGSATGCPATDARGIARPVDGNIPLDGVPTCDMGAYEFRPQKITVTVAPPFDFGTVTSATTRDNITTVGNAGDGALIIGIIAGADPLAAPFSIPADNCSGVTLPLGSTCTVTERFAPTAAGAVADAFNIPSNDPATATVSFALTGAGTAVPVPGIEVTDSIAPANDQLAPFGAVTTGSSADATVTITNTGTANLVLGAIASANPLAAPFTILNSTCSGATVAPAAACTLTVRFAPTASGLASDTFDIPSNVAGATSLTMTVNGTGGAVTSPVTPGTPGAPVTPVTTNNPPTNPVLVSPADALTGLGTSVQFVWKKAADPDGDAVTYHFMYGTDPNLAGATTVDVAAAKTAGLLFAGLGSLGGGIIMIGFVAGSGSRRSRLTTLGIIALILMGTLFTACGGGGGSSSEPATTTPPPTDEVSTTVNGLAANTTYYWKVVADDGKGGQSSSAVRSFKTQ